MLSTCLVLNLVFAIIAFVWVGQDFRGYYAVARVLITGGNPYDYDLVARVLPEVTGEMGNHPYYYSPWFAWIFIPFVTLPFQIARAVWMVIGLIILTFWSLYQRILSQRKPGSQRVGEQ